jgi:hypothetical protein
MPAVIAHHDVTDAEHWLASTQRDEFFASFGVTNIRTFVNPDQPTQVAVIMDAEDLDALMIALQTESGAASMAQDGVLPETVVVLVEE